MKFNNDNPEKDKIEEVAQTQIQTQKELISSVVKKPGHTVFECDLVTGEIRPAQYDKKEAVKFIDAAKGNISTHAEITVKEKCIYVSALNTKNVIKILKRKYKTK